LNRSSPTAIIKTISLILAFMLIAGTITTVSVYAQTSKSPFVTRSELQDALANVVTQEDLESALANVVTQEDLESALANVVTQEDLESALANVVTQEDLESALNKTLTVIKNTRCEVDSRICEQNIFQPSNFTIIVEEDNNPSQITFPGSSTGTNVELEPGPYSVTEEGLDLITPEICDTMGYDAGSDVGANLFICTNFSDECEGDITIGNPQTCIIHNTLVQQQIIGNTIYVVWSGLLDNPEIFTAKSTDGGETFSEPKNVSNTAELESSTPQIAVFGNNVYVVWVDGRDVFIVKSTDAGATFGEPKNISNNPGDSSQPQIAVSGNNVYVVWHDTESGPRDIFIAKSTDGGETFDIENLSNNPGDSVEQRISLSGNNVYIIWADNRPSGGLADIFIVSSTDGGETFSEPKNISNSGGDSDSPQIAVDGNDIYVIWRDFVSSNREIFIAKSIDGGETFDIENLSNNPGESDRPQIAVDGNDIYVIWRDSTSGNNVNLIAKSTDGGETFDIENLNNNIISSDPLKIASSENNVYVVFVNDRDIFIVSSTDGGETFSEPKNISNSGGDSDSPAIVLT
jgi:hypothetical protein